MSRRSETSTKVFVGSLPAGVTPDDLRGLFEPYGEIAECDISNRCGFLHLEDADLAMKAIADLNGTNFMGGRISVEKGRVKPRRGPGGGGGGGPVRGGRDRGGPYARNDFRGPPQRNGGGFGGRGGDFSSSYGGGSGDRFGYDRPQRGGYEGGYGDRRAAPFDDRRAGGGSAGFGAERRSYGNDFARDPYADDRSARFQETSRSEYDDRRAPAEYDDRRGGMGDRRSLVDTQGGASSFDRGAPAGDLYSRRDQGGIKPMGGAGGYDRSGYGGASSNGYNTGYGGSTGAVGYGAAAPVQSTGYGGGYGAPAQSATSYDTRGSYGGGASTGGYGASSGGYGDSYGAAGGRGSYDTAYPPLPQQRGGFASSGSPGPRRDMAPGRRF